jgi:hypothetical protein
MQVFSDADEEILDEPDGADPGAPGASENHSEDKEPNGRENETGIFYLPSVSEQLLNRVNIATGDALLKEMTAQGGKGKERIVKLNHPYPQIPEIDEDAEKKYLRKQFQPGDF